MNSFISRVKKIQDAFFKDNGKSINTKLDQNTLEDQIIDNYFPKDEYMKIMDKLVFVERSIYTDRHCFAKLFQSKIL